MVNDDPALHSAWTSGPGVQFVDVATPGLLRDALEALLSDPTLATQMGDAGRRFVESSFSWDTHVDQLESAYASVTS